jgi:hypothetical protein
LTPEQISNNQLYDDADAAKIRAKEFVEAQLKAPSSAVWPSYIDFKVARAEDANGKVIKDVWNVMGFVDSQNGSGVMLRTNWLVTIRKSSPEWQLVEISKL